MPALRPASTDPTRRGARAHRRRDRGARARRVAQWIGRHDAQDDCAAYAQSKVQAVAADADPSSAAVEDDLVQTFRASSGEPAASFTADPNGVSANRAHGAALFTLGSADEVRACTTHRLDVAVKATAPVASLFMKGSLAAAGSEQAKVRLYEASGRPPRGRYAQRRRLRSWRARRGGRLPPAKKDTVVAARLSGRHDRAVAVERTEPTALRADRLRRGRRLRAFANCSTNGRGRAYDLTHGRHVADVPLFRRSHHGRWPSSPATLVVGTGTLDGRALIVDVAESKVVHRISPRGGVRRHAPRGTRAVASSLPLGRRHDRAPRSGQGRPRQRSA